MVELKTRQSGGATVKERNKLQSKSTNFFDSVHTSTLLNLGKLVSDMFPTLAIIDATFASVSPLDRQGFRKQFGDITETAKRAVVLDKLAALTKDVILQSVSGAWKQHLQQHAERVEDTFHYTVRDYYRHRKRINGYCGQLNSQSLYTVGKYKGWHGGVSILILSSWGLVLMLDDLAAQISKDVGLEQFQQILLVVRDKRLVTGTDAAPRFSLVTCDDICLEEAQHIFDDLGISWIYI